MTTRRNFLKSVLTAVAASVASRFFPGKVVDQSATIEPLSYDNGANDLYADIELTFSPIPDPMNPRTMDSYLAVWAGPPDSKGPDDSTLMAVFPDAERTRQTAIAPSVLLPPGQSKWWITAEGKEPPKGTVEMQLRPYKMEYGTVEYEPTFRD